MAGVARADPTEELPMIDMMMSLRSLWGRAPTPMFCAGSSALTLPPPKSFSVVTSLWRFVGGRLKGSNAGHRRRLWSFGGVSSCCKALVEGGINQ